MNTAQLEKLMGSFGLTIDPLAPPISAKWLDHPNLVYGQGQPRVRHGSWNIVGAKFQQGATITDWWVLLVQDGLNSMDPGDISGLVDVFQQKMNTSGVHVGVPLLLPPATLEPRSGDSGRKRSLNIVRTLLKEELEKKKGVKPSFILVLLERTDNYIYPGIKCIGDIEMGIHTTHMQVSKAKKVQGRDQYLSNIVLKVNTKVGGINHLLEPSSMAWLHKKPTMMVGLDVAYLGPDNRRNMSSIATVVASVDQDFVQFHASLRIQRNRRGLNALKDMIVERLEVYQRRNGSLPDRIFVFRNGVPENDTNQVVNEEVPQLRNAFKELGNIRETKEYRPKISIIIWSKSESSSIVFPGTATDSDVPPVVSDVDFFLQAHSGALGITKPTRYTVVYDENDLTKDEVQRGIHDFSYLYARATNAVSVIPVAHYAKLACKRGRCYLNDFLRDNGSPAGTAAYEAAQACWRQGLHPDIKESMFYV